MQLTYELAKNFWPMCRVSSGLPDREYEAQTFAKGALAKALRRRQHGP